MGQCLSSSKAQVQPTKGPNGTKIATTSARNQKKRQLSYKDFKGIKKVDSMENFYDIKGTIGRGKPIQIL
jgi:hypothetical protein